MKKPLNQASLALALALCAAPASAFQQQHSLIFSAHNGAGYQNTLSGSSGTLLRQLDRHDLAVIAPGPLSSAETFLTHANFDVMHGDKNCDGVYFDKNTGYAIDAVTLCQNVPDPKMHNVYVSFVTDIGAPGLPPAIEDGDIVSLRIGGAHQKLISEGQIQNAMGITPNDDINIDAFCMLEDGTLVFSFEEDHIVLGGALLEDGGVAMIPSYALFYGGGDDCTVDDSSPNSGAIVFGEGNADFLVASSGISDASGAAVVTIGDLNALTVDEAGGGTGIMVQVPSTGAVIVLPDLLFNGSNLDGSGVVSSALGGSIAQLNGQLLGQPAPLPTDGLHMGMVPGTASTVRTLSGLCVLRNDSDALRFVLDTNSALPSVGSTLRLDWGGVDPGAPMQIFAKIGVPGACNAQASVPIGNPGFGYWFTSAGVLPLSLGVMGGGPMGFGSLAAPFAGPLLGIPVTFQAVTKKTGYLGVAVSSPCLMEL